MTPGFRTGCGAQPGLTKKEQLSSPIMMCVSSGNGAGPRLTLDMSFSSCNQEKQMSVPVQKTTWLAHCSGQIILKMMLQESVQTLVPPSGTKTILGLLLEPNSALRSS